MSSGSGATGGECHHKRVSASLESVLPNSVAEDEIDCCGLDQIFKGRRQSVAIYLAGK